MNIFIAIPFTLLALVAGMYLLAKTKAEALNKYFRWTAYLVILVSLLMLACNLTRGIQLMAYGRYGGGKHIEKRIIMRGDGHHDNMMNGKKRCCMEDEEDEEMEDDATDTAGVK